MSKKLFDIYKQPTGALSHKWKHYFPIYERYLAQFIGKPVRFLEIGVQAGGSLKVWQEYFGPQAEIIGVDISPDCKALEKDGFQIEIGDQGSLEFLAELKSKIGEVDVILDDGSHLPHHQIIAVNELFPILSEGGVFLCEDMYNSYLYSTGSFVEYAKGLVDELHGWWGSDPNAEKIFPTQLTKSCGGIFFHDGIVVLEKAEQTERYDLISGDFSMAPPKGKPPPEGPYITRELLGSLPINADGTTSLHQPPKPEDQRLILEELPAIGALTKRRSPKTLICPTHDPLAWTLCWGGEHQVIDDALHVDGFIRSKNYFLAEAGARYKCEFFVRISDDPTDVDLNDEDPVDQPLDLNDEDPVDQPLDLNDEDPVDQPPANEEPFIFYVGPIALDNKGAIIQNVASHSTLTRANGLQKGEIIIEALPEAYEIYVGIQGPTSDPSTRALPIFEHIQLTHLLD